MKVIVILRQRVKQTLHEKSGIYLEFSHSVSHILLTYLLTCSLKKLHDKFSKKTINRNEIENYYKTYQNWLRRKVFIQILVENKFISNNSNYLSNPTSIYDKVFSTNELLRTILSYL